MSDVKDDEIKNYDFNIWNVYDDITRNKEVIYKNLFDITDGTIQANLRIIFEKVSVFLDMKTSNEKEIRLVDALMKELAKIIRDYVPLKKIFIIDNEADNVEKINKDVELATRQIKFMLGDILNGIVEDRKKHLTFTCNRFRSGELKEFKGVRIWSAK